MIAKYGEDNDDAIIGTEIANGVHTYALIGFLLCLAAFIAYLWYQVRSACFYRCH